MGDTHLRGNLTERLPPLTIRKVFNFGTALNFVRVNRPVLIEHGNSVDQGSTESILIAPEMGTMDGRATAAEHIPPFFPAASFGAVGFHSAGHQAHFGITFFQDQTAIIQEGKDCFLPHLHPDFAPGMRCARLEAGVDDLFARGICVGAVVEFGNMQRTETPAPVQIAMVVITDVIINPDNPEAFSGIHT